jgi:hypothetical protein
MVITPIPSHPRRAGGARFDIQIFRSHLHSGLLTAVRQEPERRATDRDVRRTVEIEAHATNRVGRTTFMKANQESRAL